MHTELKQRFLKQILHQKNYLMVLEGSPNIYYNASCSLFQMISIKYVEQTQISHLFKLTAQLSMKEICYHDALHEENTS